MGTLVIDHQGCELSARNGVLHVAMPNGQDGRRVPIKYLDRVVLHSDTQLSSRTLCVLAENGVNLVALGGRGARQVAQISGTPHNDARRRWHQVLALSQPGTCAQFAHTLVLSKLRRQQATLRAIAAPRPDLRKPLHDAQQTLARIHQSLQPGPDAASGHARLDQLRGLEGAAAAAYFGAYFCAFAPALGTTGRNRRPPKDPVNATLSLSYTLLHAQATAACWSAGLDPALGALHTLSHGRAALACDLMEPYRPGIDRWVWELFKSGTLRAEHFGHDGGGACLLGKAGRAHYYSAWEQQSAVLQRSLLRYARAFARTLDQRHSQASDWAHLQSAHGDPFAGPETPLEP